MLSRTTVVLALINASLISAQSLDALTRWEEGRGIGQKTASYRWHLHDPIVFSRGLRVTFEAFGWMSPDENAERRAHSWNEREDDFASVAFWYQLGPAKKFAEVPASAERKLPGLERILVWGKDAVASGKHGKGAVRTQTGERYLESGGQLLFAPERREEGWVEYTFEVKEKEPLRLVLELTRASDCGRYQPLLNGVKLGEALDLYRPEPDLFEFHIMDFWPDPGVYALRLECAGKHRASEGELLGVNAIRLRERRPRVKAFGYDKDKDWRTEMILYR